MIAAVTLLSACGSNLRKLDEVVLYEGTNLRLSLTRYFEDVPLHWTGEIYVVHCASNETKSFHSNELPGKSGATIVQRSGALGSKSAVEVANRVREQYKVIDDKVLINADGGLFKVSFNACGDFKSWNGWNLPVDAINLVPQSSCSSKEKSLNSCPWMNFEGAAKIKFSEITVDSSLKKVSFRASSSAFKNGKDLIVSFENGGKNWIETVAE